MFIPRYWSEASHREVFPPRRQVTVRRFGWASTSQDDADVHARQRLEEAVAVLRAEGEEGLRKFRRRERVIAYSGSDGLPIREEILAEHPVEEVVLTRNSYGSVCLNTTRAMFVDVDCSVSHQGCFGCAGLFLGAVLGGVTGATGLLVLAGAELSWLHGMMVGGLVFGVLGLILGRVLFLRDRKGSDPVRWAVDRAAKWCEAHPDWLVKIYETPAGARVLPLHDTFDAAEENSFEFMKFLRADPLYVRMCRLQKCFRARVSPKPWRAGLPRHFPAGGTWPVRDPAKLERRREWVQAYEELAEGYAACRAVETVGAGVPDRQVEAIRNLHDELSRAEWPIAIA